MFCYSVPDCIEAIRSGAFFIFPKLRINTIFEAKDVTEMEFMTGTQQKTLSAADLKGGSFLNQTVCVHGAVHAIRAMGAIEFVTLRLRDGALQCVVDEAHGIASAVEGQRVIIGSAHFVFEDEHVAVPVTAPCGSTLSMFPWPT